MFNRFHKAPAITSLRSLQPVQMQPLGDRILVEPRDNEQVYPQNTGQHNLLLPILS